MIAATTTRLNHAKLSLAAILLAFSTGAFAAEDPAKQLTPLEKEVDTIRGMLINANMKFQTGAVDIASSGSSVTATPARLCCSGNLEYIANSMTKLREILRDRTACFERKRSIQDVEIATIAVRDMRVLASSIKLFEESENPLEVNGALASCTRAFLRMAETFEVLPECSLASAGGKGSGK